MTDRRTGPSRARRQPAPLVLFVMGLVIGISVGAIMMEFFDATQSPTEQTTARSEAGTPGERLDANAPDRIDPDWRRLVGRPARPISGEMKHDAACRGSTTPRTLRRAPVASVTRRGVSRNPAVVTTVPRTRWPGARQGGERPSAVSP